jgi:hypothetical protein
VKLDSFGTKSRVNAFVRLSSVKAASTSKKMNAGASACPLNALMHLSRLICNLALAYVWFKTVQLPSCLTMAQSG